MGKSPTFTAQDLVRRFVAMHVLIPNFREWTREELEDLPHPLRKLQELEALFAAFGVPWGPGRFVEGEAIRMTVAEADAFTARVFEDKPDLQERLGHAEVFVPKSSPTDLSPRRDIRHYFAELYRFRHRAEQFLTDGRIIYEADLLTLCAMDDVERWTRAVESVLRRDDILQRVDETLAAMLDPAARTFSLSKLVSTYGFPRPRKPKDDDDPFDDDDVF